MCVCVCVCVCDPMSHVSSRSGEFTSSLYAFTFLKLHTNTLLTFSLCINENLVHI